MVNKKEVLEKKRIYLIEIFSGTHHKKSCSNESDIARWTETDKFFEDNREYLFPKPPLSINLKYQGKRPFKQPNGGWSDLRDRQLCLSFAFKDTKNLSSFNINI
jgi:hypothetical protein